MLIRQGLWRWCPKVLSFHPTRQDSRDERMYSCFAGIGLWLLRRFQFPASRNEETKVLGKHWCTTQDLVIIQKATGGSALLMESKSGPQDVKDHFGMLWFHIKATNFKNHYFWNEDTVLDASPCTCGVLSSIQYLRPLFPPSFHGSQRVSGYVFYTSFQENYNTPLEHTPGNPPGQLWKEYHCSLLLKV